MKTKRRKLVEVVIRGCVFRVSACRALELERLEKEAIRREWNTNNLP